MKRTLFTFMVAAVGVATTSCSKSSEPLPNSTGGTTTASGGSSAAKSGGTTGSNGGSGGTSSSAGGSGGTSSSGGTVAKGGTSGSGGAGGGSTCTATANVSPCGGDVVGTWNVTSSCLAVTGNLDMSGFGIGCASAPITGSLKVTGTWTAKSDGTYSDSLTISGTEQITLGAACLTISGTTTTCVRLADVIQSSLGYEAVTCTNASGGCACTATLQQAQSSSPGAYATTGNVVAVSPNGDNPFFMNYGYCVSGGNMTWTPQSTGTTGTVAGTIVLQKQGSGGSGGAGGATGNGGSSGSAGASATGGRNGVGGAAGAAGATARGGSNGSGGATPGSGGATPGTGGAAGAGGTPPSGSGPCDIYAAASPATPCVAAFSTTRQLSSQYTGPLYQVRKGGSWSASSGMTGGTFQDIGMVAGGYADSAAQDTFCSGGTCTFSVLYDQSGKKNDLKVAPKGCYTGTASEPDSEAAASHSTTLNGHKVYSLYTVAHNGYRNNATSGVPIGDVGQGIYEVADGKRLGAACCFDFGNAAPNNCNGGTMTALFFGTGYWDKGASPGPWFLGDFEAGVWAGGSASSTGNTNNNNPAMAVPYAFGILKSGPGNYAIRAADGQSGTLKTAWDGAQPKTLKNQGAIVLGIGGDNSNSSLGTFFEGAITNGRPSDATDALVLTNVQSAGYGK